MAVIDVDQHLSEHRTLWRDHVDPGARDDALAIVDDERGYAWLTWRDRRIQLADVQVPGDTDALGEHRRRLRSGLPPTYRYDEALPAAHGDPSARVAFLDEAGLDEAVCFPNFGLLWERPLAGSLAATTANMGAWNRWCASVVVDSGGRVNPVGHVTLRDPDWLRVQLRSLAAAGVRLAMVAPALVDGRPLSHADHEPLWHAFVEHGIAPVFHVADQPRVIDDAWITDADETFVPTLDAVFLWTAPAVALADLVLNGVLDRHPDLRVGVVELGSTWVPLYLLMLDGGADFTARLNGRPLAELALRPSDYVRRQVRFSSFSYEQPVRLARQAGELFMCCSDYPHSEGTATPLADYRRSGCEPGDAPALFHDGAAWLLGR